MQVQMMQYGTICVVLICLSIVVLYKTRLDQKRTETDVRILKKRQAVQVKLNEIDEL